MLEILGMPYGWRKGSGDWDRVKEALVHHHPIQVIQEAGSTQWQFELPPSHSFYFGFPEYTETIREQPPTPKARVWISPIQRRFAPGSSLPKVQWHPRVLWVGIGCERGVSHTLIAQAIGEILRSHHLAKAAIAGLATIDTKSNETGLGKFCREHHYPLRYFSAEELRVVSVPHPSNIVNGLASTPSVSEAAAILASETPQSLVVSKKIFRVARENGSVTIAIAQAEQEYNDQQSAPSP